MAGRASTQTTWRRMRRHRILDYRVKNMLHTSLQNLEQYKRPVPDHERMSCRAITRPKGAKHGDSEVSGAPDTPRALPNQGHQHDFHVRRHRLPHDQLSCGALVPIPSLQVDPGSDMSPSPVLRLREVRRGDLRTKEVALFRKRRIPRGKH